MKDAMRASETSYIEQAMYEDKLRATDWEATSDAISEAVLRESRLQFLIDQEKQIQSSAAISPRSSPPSSTGFFQCTSGNNNQLGIGLGLGLGTHKPLNVMASGHGASSANMTHSSHTS